jgi:tRNA-splicing ligase RtcB
MTALSGPMQLADTVWSWLPAEEIEPGTMTQIQNVAALPCAAHVAVMPDAHKGYGMPIGCALATRAAVVPYAVGVDIGCGMIAVKTSLGTSWPRESIQAALVGIFARVPVGQPSKKNRNGGSFTDRQNSSVLREWSAERGARDANARAVRERADRQVGTLGGGNHFIEIQSDGTNLWLMLHTGSRAFGKYVCDYYHAIAVRECDRHHTPLPDKELAFLLLDAVDGEDYLQDMQFAMRFAEESRARIKTQALEALTETFGAFDVLETIETHHNFAAVEQHMGKPVVVHRKGAVRTTSGPLVTIPGSMQTGSYIGRGIPNVRALDTCSHGAGRRLGRNQTRRDNVGVDIKAEMAAEGIELVCPPDSDALDEAGRAYKDIENVMRYQADLVEPVVKLTPLGVVKG